jgi:hypothetical protein
MHLYGIVLEHGATLSVVGYKNSLSLLATCFYTGFLLGLFFDPENEGDLLLRNVGLFSAEYSAFYRRR